MANINNDTIDTTRAGTGCPSFLSEPPPLLMDTPPKNNANKTKRKDQEKNRRRTAYIFPKKVHDAAKTPNKFRLIQDLNYTGK